MWCLLAFFAIVGGITVFISSCGSEDRFVLLLSMTETSLWSYLCHGALFDRVDLFTYGSSSILYYYILDLYMLWRYFMVSLASPNVIWSISCWIYAFVIFTKASSATLWTAVIGVLYVL